MKKEKKRKKEINENKPILQVKHKWKIQNGKEKKKVENRQMGKFLHKILKEYAFNKT